MFAEFIGKQVSAHDIPPWSNPANWAGGKVPVSSNGLHILVDGSSLEDLGTAQNPFVAQDVISTNLSHPLLAVDGFLSVRDAIGVSLEVLGGLHVSRALIDPTYIGIGGKGTVEIGQGIIGPTTIDFTRGVEFPGASDGTLILDKAPRGSFDDLVRMGGGLGSPLHDKVELGGVSFDHADVIPNPSGDFTLRLTNHGAPVYQLTHVGLGGGTVSVGVDPKTGYDFVSYSQTD
jgi:hypothetical protein